MYYVQTRVDVIACNIYRSIVEHYSVDHAYDVQVRDTEFELRE